MAVTIDNLGRRIEQTNMTLGEIKGLIGSLMSSKVGAARPVGGKEDATSSKDNISKLTSIFQQYAKDFTKEVSEQKKLLSDVVETLRNFTQARSEKAAGPKDKPAPTKEEIGIKNATEALRKEFHKTLGTKGSAWVHDIHCEAVLKKIYAALKLSSGDNRKALNRYSKSVDKALKSEIDKRGAGGGGDKIPTLPTGTDDDGGGGRGRGKPSGSSKDRTITYKGTPLDRDIYEMYMYIRMIQEQVNKFENALVGFRTMEVVLKGMVKEEREFVQQTRQIAYETGNATKETHALNRAYENIGKTVEQTGVDRDAYQESYKRALKGGIRDLKIANSLVKSQLNTETQLGMKAGELADEFRSLNTAGRMTNGQLADMGRGMREVARNTGLTGDNLKSVVSNSKQFIDAMRNAATLTSAAAKNVMEIGANAQKLGIESEMQPLLKAMTSSSDLIVSASSETQALLFRAAGSVGRINDLMNGTILRSKSGIKAMAQGVNNVLKQFGVESMEAIDQLSDSAKRDLNLRLKAAYGVELGQLRSQFDALNEAGKTMSDRMADIEKRQSNLTLEEKAALLEEERRLKTSKSLEVLTALDEAAKGAKSMDQALAKFGERRKEFDEDLAAMGIAATDNADIARQSVMSAVQNINEGLKKAGKSELKIDSSEIEKALKDPTAMRELTAKISDGEQKLATAQKAQLDPMNEMNQYLKEINDTLRTFINAGISGLFNSIIGKILVFGAAIAGVVSAVTFSGYQLYSSIDTLGRMFKQDSDDKSKEEKSFFERLYDKYFKRSDKKAKTGEAEEINFADKATNEIFAQMLKVLEDIKNCVCKGLTSPAQMDVSSDLEAKELKNIKAEEKLNKRKKKSQNTEDALLKKDIKAAQAGGEVQCPALPGSDCFDIEALKKSGGQMLKMAAAIAILVVGVVALGAAIVFLGKKILSAFNLSLSSVLEIAGTIGALAAAGVAIAAAGIGVFKALESDDAKKLGDDVKTKGPNLAQLALAIGVLGPAMVLLGAAIVKMSQLILQKLNLNLSTVGETAAVIVSVVGAAAAVTMGAAQALEAYEKLEGTSVFKRITEKPVDFAKMLGKGAVALLVLGPALVLLGAAVVKMAQLILGAFKLDAKTAADVGMSVASIVLATGAIAASIIAASYGLKLLGDFSEEAKNMIPEMVKGAVAFALLTPAIVALAGGVLWLTQKIMGGLGLDSSVAAKTAWDVASLIGASAVIAVSIIGAMAGLAALGLLLPYAGPAAGSMLMGALAFAILTPAIVALASGVIFMTQKVMKGFGVDSGVAAKVASDVANLLASAVVISVTIMGAMAGLAGLSLLLPFAWAAVLPMTLGAVAFRLLTPAIIALAAGVIALTSAVMKTIIDPTKAVAVAKSVSDVIGAAASISASVIGAGAALSLIGLAVGSGAFWILAALAGLGAIALMAMTPAIIKLSSAIIGIAKDFLKLGLDPKKSAEVAQGLSSVIKSASTISWAVLSSFASLSILGSMSVAIALMIPYMLAGAVALMLLTPAVIGIANAITQIGLGVMNLGMNPKQATEVAGAVGSIIESAGKVANQIIYASGKLAALSLLAPVALYIAGLMYLGVGALTLLSLPIKSYIQTIVDFSKSIGSTLNPKQASEMANGVASIIESSGKVADQIISASGKLGALALLWPISSWIAGAMYLGTDALLTMSTPIRSFVATIVSLAQSLQSSVNPSAAKGMVKSLTNISTIIDLVSKVMNNLHSKITPLTQDGWFTDSPIKQMSQAKDKMAIFFPTLVDFIQTIVNKVGTSKGKAKELDGAARSLRAMAMVLDATLPAIKIMSEKLGPLTQGGIIWGDSPLEKIKAAIPQFNGFFSQIGGLVNSIVFATMFIGKPKQLQEAGYKMRLVASVLDSTATSIKSLSAVVGMMDGSIFTESPIQKIKRNALGFKLIFFEIASLVTNGIVYPINEVIPDGKELQKAACILVALGKVLSGTKATLESLASIMGLMDAKSFFSVSPLQKIIDNKAKFAIWFYAIAKFVNEGIVLPVTSIFTDATKLSSAASIITQLATIAKNIVPMINNLSNAIALATDSQSFFGKAPMEKIMASKDLFARWFNSIAIFMRDGIVNPVNKEMQGVDISSASKTITSMSKIASEIVPLMNNLGKAMNLMSDPSERTWDTDFPIDKIMVYKTQFSMWFQKIAEFMRDGIVVPILTVLPEPRTIQMASNILSAMSNIVKQVPIVINGIADGLMPLISSDVFGKETAKEKLEGKTGIFKDWFTSVAKFMVEGIVLPILTVLPEGSTLQVASRSMTAMSNILTTIPVVIKKLSSLFVPLNPNDCFAEAPVQMLARNAPLFASWFSTVTMFIRDAIIDPILYGLPSESDIESVADRLRSTNTVVGMLGPFLRSLASSIINLAVSTMDFGVMTAMMFAPRLKNVANTLIDGIIGPIRMMPSSDELAEINNQMDQIGIALEKADMVMTVAGEKINKFAMNAFWRFIENWKADQFGARFTNMANALNDGIIKPMTLLPSSSQIGEVVKQLDAMVMVLKKVEEVLATMELAMKSIGDSKLDFSSISKLPLDKIAAFTSAIGNMSAAGPATPAPAAGGANAGVTPSDQAIQQRLDSKQAESQSLVARSMTELINNATRGDGILVKDMMTAKNTESLLKSASFNTDMRPAIRVADMRPAIESMKDSPIEKAQRNEINERQTRNRFTIARDQRKESLRLSKEAAGLQTVNSNMLANAGKMNSPTIQLANFGPKNPDAITNLTQPGDTTPFVAQGGTTNASVQPAMAASQLNDVQSAVAQDRASSQPATVQAVSPELGNLTHEASTQNEKLDVLIELFSKVLQTLQPKPAPTQSSGGERNSTKPNQVTGNPPNFYRNTVGLVSQTPAKAALNLGGRA